MEEEQEQLDIYLELNPEVNYDPIYRAYELLVSTINTKDIDKDSVLISIEEAIGYLGEALE